MKSMGKDEKLNIYLLLSGLLVSSLIFSQLPAPTKVAPASSAYQSDQKTAGLFSDSKIECKDKNDEPDILGELEYLLANDTREVNCIFSGCSSFF